jgi:hypothetical protein
MCTYLLVMYTYLLVMYTYLLVMYTYLLTGYVYLLTGYVYLLTGYVCPVKYELHRDVPIKTTLLEHINHIRMGKEKLYQHPKRRRLVADYLMLLDV